MKKLFLLSTMALVMLASCEKNNQSTSKEDPSTSVADGCGNTYKEVTIGSQTWMAENMKCNKYDTESEAYNASWLTNNTIPTSSESVLTPYYTDATDKTNWSDTEYSDKLSSEQIAKLGYLYSWAAAVGVENGGSQKTEFTGRRQGICPNGWHIPTQEEWKTLGDFLDGDNGITDGGKKLMATSGWFDDGNGTDTYGFAALPAGSAEGSSVEDVGCSAFFWMSTLHYKDANYSYKRYLNAGEPELESEQGYMADGNSVRCIKN